MNEDRDNPQPVGRVPSRGAAVGRLPPAGAVVGRVPSRGADEPPPRRLRRLHRVWPDRDGNISYLLTICVDGRARVLDNEATFDRLVAFLLDSPARYGWFGRRFVIMPDHLHLIAHQGHDAIRLGPWIKALKAVVGGLKRRDEGPVGAPGLQQDAASGIAKPAASGDAAYKGTRPADVGRLPSAGAVVGRVPPPGVPAGRVPPRGESASSPGVPPTGGHTFTRLARTWQWQDGFHDHKFRTLESEARKWEYVCLNPVRYGLVQRPEEWPYGGEVFYDEPGGPRLVRGTPPLLETGVLIEEDGTPRKDDKAPDEGTNNAPREGTRPTG